MTHDTETADNRRALAAGIIALASWILLIYQLTGALHQPLLV